MTLEQFSERISQEVESAKEILDEGNVGNEFLGGDTANEPHQKAFSHEGVGGGHDMIGFGE